MSNIVFKVSYKENTHRFSIPKNELTIQKLQETLNKMFGPCVSKFDLKYEDTDGDIITLKSDYDLTEAMNVFSELPNKVIRLKLVQRRGRLHHLRFEDSTNREEKTESKEAEPKKEEPKIEESKEEPNRESNEQNNQMPDFSQFGSIFESVFKNISKNINQEDFKKVSEQMKLNNGLFDFTKILNQPFFKSFGLHHPAPEVVPDNEQEAPQDNSSENPIEHLFRQPHFHHRMPFFRGVRNRNCEDKLEVKKLEQATKTWKVKNFGPFAWPVGSELTYIGGDKLSANRSFTFENEVAPGEEIEIELSFTAPEQPGNYKSFYRLATPKGAVFGRRMRVFLNVIDSDDQIESTEEVKNDVEESNDEDAETQVTIEDVKEEEYKGKYAEEIKKLNDMGFYDDDLSIRVLDSFNGELMVAIEKLLSWQ